MQRSRGALFVLTLTVVLLSGCAGGGGESGTDAADAGGDAPEPAAEPTMPDVDPSTLPGGFPVANLSGKPITDWSRQLLEAHDGIVRCLAQEEAPADAIVAKAWMMDEGRAAVRLSTPDGGKWHCESTADETTLTSLGSDAGGTFYGDIFFVPEDRERPAGDGFVHESVVDAEASFLGWLSTRVEEPEAP